MFVTWTDVIKILVVRVADVDNPKRSRMGADVIKILVVRVADAENPKHSRTGGLVGGAGMVGKGGPSTFIPV